MLFPFRSAREVKIFEDRVYRDRETTMEKIATLVSYGQFQEKRFEEYETLLEQVASQPMKSRRTYVSNPLFRIWLRTVVRAVSGMDFDLSATMIKIADIRNISKRFFLEEEDVPPIVRSVIPPTYEFSKPYILRHAPSICSAKYAFAIKTAIRRAGTKFDGFEQMLSYLIKSIIVLGEADFRSCSAERYLGIIIIGTSDQSLIELEESIVHEYGHQLLYQLDILDHIFVDRDDAEDIVLPWSGTSRNYYGFYHACFIYAILRKYYKRSIDQRSYDESYCKDRLMFIQDGLVEALPLLSKHTRLLTDAGNSL